MFIKARTQLIFPLIKNVCRKNKLGPNIVLIVPHHSVIQSYISTELSKFLLSLV